MDDCNFFVSPKNDYSNFSFNITQYFLPCLSLQNDKQRYKVDDFSVCFHQIKMDSNSELLKIQQQYIFKHVFFAHNYLYRCKVVGFAKFSFTEEAVFTANSIFRLVSFAHV